MTVAGRAVKLIAINCNYCALFIGELLIALLCLRFDEISEEKNCFGIRLIRYSLNCYYIITLIGFLYHFKILAN